MISNTVIIILVCFFLTSSANSANTPKPNQITSPTQQKFKLRTCKLDANFGQNLDLSGTFKTPGVCCGALKSILSVKTHGLEKVNFNALCDQYSYDQFCWTQVEDKLFELSRSRPSSASLILRGAKDLLLEPNQESKIKNDLTELTKMLNTICPRSRSLQAVKHKYSDNDFCLKSVGVREKISRLYCHNKQYKEKTREPGAYCMHFNSKPYEGMCELYRECWRNEENVCERRPEHDKNLIPAINIADDDDNQRDQIMSEFLTEFEHFPILKSGASTATEENEKQNKNFSNEISTHLKKLDAAVGELDTIFQDINSGSPLPPIENLPNDWSKQRSANLMAALEGQLNGLLNVEKDLGSVLDDLSVNIHAMTTPEGDGTPSGQEISAENSSESSQDKPNIFNLGLGDFKPPSPNPFKKLNFNTERHGSGHHASGNKVGDLYVPSHPVDIGDGLPVGHVRPPPNRPLASLNVLGSMLFTYCI